MSCVLGQSFGNDYYKVWVADETTISSKYILFFSLTRVKLLIYNQHFEKAPCVFYYSNSEQEVGTPTELPLLAGQTKCRCEPSLERPCSKEMKGHHSPGLTTSTTVSSINQSNVFIKPFLHQLMSHSAVQRPSLKPQNSKQCRCRSTVARKNSLERPGT